MNKICLIALIFITVQSGHSAPLTGVIRNDSLTTTAFGKILLYEPAGIPGAVVLFISGDGGWKNNIIDMANILCAQGALVAGIDIRRYYHGVKSAPEKCFYPAGDLEALGKTVEKWAGLPVYQPPILAGNSAGATLVYAALTEAPEGTFSGGVSLGFCPDMEAGKEPCRGNGLRTYRITKPAMAWMLEPDPALKTPWYLLQGENDGCCSFEQAQAFARQIPAASLVSLPKVGHGFTVEKNWAPQFKSVFEKLSNNTRTGEAQSIHTAATLKDPSATSLSDLPLTVTLVKSGVSDRMAVLLSGDGGWTDFDQGIADGLAARGIPVVGLNTLQYFWKERTPETATADLTRVLQAYTQLFGKKEVLLVGYSFGAGVLPFLYNRLNNQEKKQIRAMALLSPGDKAEFAFHFSSWLNHYSSDAHSLVPELEKMYGCRTLFLFGSDENTRWLAPLIKNTFSLQIFKGGHHFGDNTGGIAAAIGAL